MRQVTVAVVGIVAGGREHEAAPVRDGHPLLVLARPDHPIDPNAVGVYRVPGDGLDGSDESMVAAIEAAGDHLIGYLPASMVKHWQPTETDAAGGRYAMGTATRVQLDPTGQHCIQLDVTFTAESRP